MDTNAPSRLLTLSKRAGLVPMLPDYKTYAAVVRTTPPELRDTSVSRRRRLSGRPVMGSGPRRGRERIWVLKITPKSLKNQTF